MFSFTSGASSMSRRQMLTGLAASGAIGIIDGVNAQGRANFRLQYDWVMDNGRIGDIVALKRGYFDAEGISFSISPGGPNAQTVPSVLTGQAQAGQMGSNQVLTAYASGIPVRMIATTYQNEPLVFVSMRKSPVRSPKDFVGKTVAVTPNGRWLLNLMLSVNKIDPSHVRIVTLGGNLAPLLLGQADVAVAFTTNSQALATLGPDRVMMSAREAGVAYYTGTYFVSADDYIKNKDSVARFVRALSKGWGWAFENRKAAVDLMCDAYPNLDRQVEYEAVDTVMSLAFSKDTATHGWGWIDGARLQREIDVFASGGGFAKRIPDLAGVFTREILDMTADVRPKLG